MNDLGRISRFKTLIRECFAQESNVGNQGRLKVKLVKAYFAQQQKQKQFSDAEFDARTEEMVNEKKLERDGDKIFEPEPV